MRGLPGAPSPGLGARVEAEAERRPLPPPEV